MDESRLLTHAIATAWPDQPPPEMVSIEPALVAALRALDASSPGEARQPYNQVLELIRRVPTLEKEVKARIHASLAVAVRDGSTAPQLLTRRSEVTVLYATNRLRTGEMQPARRFGPGRGHVTSYGAARVQLPDDHRMGRLPSPRPWPLRFGHRGQLGLTLTEVTTFTPMCATAQHRSPGRDVLLFVHGYNVGFAPAVRRTAQLAYDLNFAGVPVVYSWPSEATTGGYLIDGENAAASVRTFRHFLETLIATTKDGRVHVVAHSMGNRILTEALSTMGTYQLGHVVFAAPDVDAAVFADRVDAFAGRADRYTLYVSDKDRALAAAKRLVRYSRAGSAGTDILVLDGVDTIDASALDTGLLSHSYAMEHRSIVADMYALIRHNLPPEERFGMQPMMSPRGPYWSLRP